MFDLTTILSELVATPSVNPMGRSADSSEFYEYRLTDYLEQLFRAKRHFFLAAAHCTETRKHSCVRSRRSAAGARRRPAAPRSTSRHGAGRWNDYPAVRSADSRWATVRPRLVRHQRRNGGDAGGDGAIGSKSLPAPRPTVRHGLHSERRARLHRRDGTVPTLVRRRAATERNMSVDASPARCCDRRRTDQSECGRRTQRHGPLALPYDQAARHTARSPSVARMPFFGWPGCWPRLERYQRQTWSAHSPNIRCAVAPR